MKRFGAVVAWVLVVITVVVVAAALYGNYYQSRLRGTSWRLVTLDGATPIQSGILTLIFAQDGTVSGRAGCNSFSAGYFSVRRTTIYFPGMFSTLVACFPNEIMQQENAYLGTLRGASHYQLSDDQLVITTHDDKQLVFVPLED